MPYSHSVVISGHRQLQGLFLQQRYGKLYGYINADVSTVNFLFQNFLYEAAGILVLSSPQPPQVILIVFMGLT